MKAALCRIFWKQLPLLVVILAAFAGCKYFTVSEADAWIREYPWLDGWAAACADLEEDEVEDFVQSLTQQISSDTGLLKRTEYDAGKFLSSYYNRQDVGKLITFARTGEGQLPAGVPENYLEVLDFYRELEAPHIINEQPLDRYFSYQAQNIVPVLVLLLGAFFWGMHFESGICDHARTTKAGRRYSAAVSMILITLSLLLTAFNEWFDLHHSGLLERAWLLASPIQSYSKFADVQMNCSIGAVLTMSLCAKLLGVMILNHAAWLIARLHRSLKTTLIWSFLLLIVLLFLGKALENTDVYPAVQIGIVDWQALIAKNRLLPTLKVTPLALGLGITGAIQLVLAALCARLGKE